MIVTQLNEWATKAAAEVLGESAVVNEDLSNIVDVGKQLDNLYVDHKGVENFLHSINDMIGKTIVVNRPTSRDDLGILKDGTEYGSIVRKIAPELPKYTENQSWQLQDGSSYDDNVFYQPKAKTTFFNSKSALEIDTSRAFKQTMSAFDSPLSFNAFFAGLDTFVRNSYNMAIDELEQRTINNMIAATIYNEYGTAALASKSTVKAVNLLKRYNDLFSKTLTAANCTYDPDFIRYASSILGEYMKRMRKFSTLFNIDGEPRHTPTEFLHVILHSAFVERAGAYLQSDVFHNEFTALPNARTVSYWQGTGTDFEFANTTAINTTVKYEENSDSKATVSASGILGVMFDHDALGVYNEDMRVYTHFVKSGEFFNNFHKWDAHYFNAFDENFVVFFVA